MKRRPNGYKLEKATWYRFPPPMERWKSLRISLVGSGQMSWPFPSAKATRTLAATDLVLERIPLTSLRPMLRRNPERLSGFQ